MTLDTPSPWLLDPSVVFLNHGSFGACPRQVLDAQQAWRLRMERQPMQLLARELEPLLDAARAELGAFVNADPESLAFVPNATSAVNAVLRSIPWKPGDELLTTDHTYNACRNALEFVAEAAGASVVVAKVPFPIASAQQVLDAILPAVSPATRLALIDHVTSPTALVLPVGQLIAELSSRGVDVLVDGAHAPGMLPLDLRSLGAAWYTGNCHKWLCAPKGAAFLCTRKDKQQVTRPAIISHGDRGPRRDRSRYRLEFDWTGTQDPTAALCVPEAIRTLGALLPGGWPALMRHNTDLALFARDTLCEQLGQLPPAPDSMLGAMAAVPLPPSLAALDPAALQRELLERFAIEVPIIPWGEGRSLVRISAQQYNKPDDYLLLARALDELMRRA